VTKNKELPPKTPENISGVFLCHSEGKCKKIQKIIQKYKKCKKNTNI